MTRTVITGGAGSGKSTVLADRVGDYLATHRHTRQPGIVVCAPSTAGVHAIAARLADHLPPGSTLLTGTIRDLAHHGTRPMPHPWVLVADQVEDCEPNELDLVTTWDSNAVDTFAAADVDQQVTVHTGASPASISAFVHTADQHVLLTRSHRVPAAVADLTALWVDSLPNPHRAALTPTDETGTVRATAAAVHDPVLVDQLAADIDLGHTVLVATLSGALLGPLVANLRHAGIPHRDLTAPEPNPRIAETLAQYLALDEREQPDTARAWTGADLRSFLAICHPSGAGLRARARQLVEALPADEPVPFELLADVWEDDSQRARALDPDPAWLLDAAKPGYRARLRRLVAVAEHNGHAELVRPPRVLVGTVHAAKHVEADVVYLAPDLTPGQADDWWGGRRARLMRLMHVAVTRARAEVVRLAPQSKFSVPDAAFLTERGQP